MKEGEKTYTKGDYKRLSKRIRANPLYLVIKIYKKKIDKELAQRLSFT